jgi:metal-sulfur cluster biosynthetic enzyme
MQKLLSPGDQENQALHLQLMQAINGVLDPCSEVAKMPAGLVDMGMIDSVHIHQLDQPTGKSLHVEVQFGLTEPGCMMAVSLMPKIRQAVLAVPGVDSTKVNLLPAFVWSADRMEASLRARLGQINPSHQEATQSQTAVSSMPINFHRQYVKA